MEGAVKGQKVVVAAAKFNSRERDRLLAMARELWAGLVK